MTRTGACDTPSFREGAIRSRVADGQLWRMGTRSLWALASQVYLREVVTIEVPGCVLCERCGPTTEPLRQGLDLAPQSSPYHRNLVSDSAKS